MYKNKTNKKKLSIFLDFANTICFLKKNKILVLKKFLNQKRIKVKNDKIDYVLNKVEEKFFYSELNVKDSKKNFYLRYNNYIQKELNLTNLKDFPLEYYNFVKENKNKWFISKKIIQLLKIKSCQYDLYLASNFSMKAYEILKKYNIEKYFKKIYVSKKIKYEKPNVNFYKYIITNSNINPRLSYFVGDNIILDYKLPKRFQFNAYLLNKNYLNKKSIKACTNLNEFFKLIERK